MTRIVNKRALASILGISERSLTAWQVEGMPVQLAGARGKGNRYSTKAVIDWRIARELEKATARTPRDQVAIRQARLLDLEIAEREGDLIPRAEIRPAWIESTAAARQSLRALPSSLAPLLAQMQGADPMRDLLDDAIEEVLKRLATDDDDPNLQPGDAETLAGGAGVLGAAAANAAVRVGGKTPKAARGIGDAGQIPVRPDAVPAGDP